MRIILILIQLVVSWKCLGQISTAIYAGPNNDGMNIIEICVSLTNIFPNEINLEAGQEQIVVIQFGDAPINADFTAQASCLRSDEFEVISTTISELVESGSVNTSRSDPQDFEFSFRFEEDVRFAPGDQVELFCARNTMITGSCDNLVYLVDCSGTQFTVFNNGTLRPVGIEDCTEGYAQQCNPFRPEAMSMSLLAANPRCPGGTSGNITVDLSGGIEPFQYAWNTTDSTPVLNNIRSGTYAVTVTDSLGCFLTESVTLTDGNGMELSFTEVAPCPDENNGSIQVEVAEGGQAPFTYLWSTLDEVDGISMLGEGRYLVTVTDANDCTAIDSLDLVGLSDEPISVFCMEMNNSFITFGWDMDSSAHFYEVNINDGGWIDVGNVQTYTEQGLMENDEVRIEVRGVRDCPSMRQGSVECIAFEFTIDNSVFIPNVFSPNGDAQNDHFVISGRQGVIINSLRLYDVWGNFIFEQKDIQPGEESTSFDGRVNGEFLRPQVLVYHLVVQFPDGRIGETTGDITIIR